MGAELKNITRGTVIYGLGQGINRLLAFITLPVFTAFLSPNDFGLIALLALFGFFARAVFGLGIGVSMGIVYFRHENQSHRVGVVFSALAILAISASTLLVVSASRSDLVALYVLSDADLGRLVWLQALVVVAQVLGEPLLLRFQYESKPVLYILVSVGAAVLGVAAALVLVAWADRGVSGWVEGYLLGAVVALLAGLAVTIVQLRGVRARIDRLVVIELLRLGCPLIPSFFFLFLIQNSGVYFLRMFEELAAAGVYHVGWSIGMAMGVATGAFTTAWFPFFKAYVNRPKEGAPLFQVVRELYVFVFGFLCLSFFLFSWPVVLLATTEGFLPAYRVVGWVALAQFLVGFWSTLLPGVYFARQVHYVTLIQGAAAAVATAANLALIPRFGAEGTAIAMAVAMLAMVVFQLVLNARKRYAVTTGNWCKIGVLASSISVVILAYLTLDAWVAFVITSTVVAVLMAIFLAVGWRLGLMPRRGQLADFLLPSRREPT